MALRTSGILLHPASLPGRFGIGDLGPEAFRFVDLLHRGQQHLWQMLPLNPTRSQGGHSPYYAPSTFAGDPLLISPETLYRQGFLTRAEWRGISALPEGPIDRVGAARIKGPVLARACARLSSGRARHLLDTFSRRQRNWLDTYSLFTVLDRHFHTPSWCEWPPALRDRDPHALQSAARRFSLPIARERCLQFFFFDQWRQLKRYCRLNQVRIFGDMPIYVPLHSADVWAHPHLFKLGPDRRPAYVSGVPPDYFSATGQRWGHPVYDWSRLREEHYRWWIARIAWHRALFDLFRIDHFRGLVAYWEVPAGARTALNGTWQPAAGDELLALATRRLGPLPIVAEDLGAIDADVREIMRRWSLPGMRVLQFAFGDDFPGSAFLPHNHIRRCVVYTGTHDNNTVAGWLRQEASPQEKKRFFDYLGYEVDAAGAGWAMIRLALQSVAATAVLPIQDILQLDESARINHPGRVDGNWQWRLAVRQLTDAPVDRLAELTRTCGRGDPTG